MLEGLLEVWWVFVRLTVLAKMANTSRVSNAIFIFYNACLLLMNFVFEIK